MKKTLRLLSLIMALMLILSVFAACQNNQGNEVTDPSDVTTAEPGKELGTQITIWWLQGQKELRKDTVKSGDTLTSWTPTVSGKIFVGWYSDPGCTKAFDFTKPVTNDTEIFASFKTDPNAGGDVGGDDEETETPDYYLVGQGVGSLSNAAWDPQNYSLPMVDQGNAQYTITIDFYAGDKFQICHGGSWDGQMGIGCIPGAALISGSETEAEVKDKDGNVVFTGVQDYSNPITAWNITCAAGRDGKYKFTLDAIAGTITWEFISALEPKDPTQGGSGEHTYTVAGTAGLCGSEWDPAATQNDMTLVNGVYTITFENVAGGEQKFKITQDHAWTVSFGDINNSDSNNVVINVTEGATVVITFDPATGTITAKDSDGNNLWGDGSVGGGADPEIYFVGTFNEWDTTGNSEYILTLGADGKTWTGTLIITEEMYGENGCAEMKLFDYANNDWLANSGDSNLNLTVGTYHFKYVVGESHFSYWADGESEPTMATVVYLVPEDWGNNSLMAAWCWPTGGDGSWVILTDLDADGVWECAIPAGCDNILFVDFSDEITSADWYEDKSLLVQTPDMSVPVGSNVYYHVNSHSWTSSK